MAGLRESSGRRESGCFQDKGRFGCLYSLLSPQDLISWPESEWLMSTKRHTFDDAFASHMGLNKGLFLNNIYRPIDLKLNH